jgi:hypothetical protein
MKVNRGDSEGGNPFMKGLSKAIDTAHRIISKPVPIGSSTETIYTIKTKEGEMKVTREVFEYIKRNDIEQITNRVFAEILLKVEKEKLKISKVKGAQSNKEKNDIAYRVITDLVKEQGITEAFLQSSKLFLKQWGNENKTILFERFTKQFPHARRAKIKLPLSESSLYQFQQRFKKECQEWA